MSSSAYAERARILVVDANILIGVVLGGRTHATRTIFLRLVATGVTLLAPEELLTELEANLPRLILRRSNEQLSFRQRGDALQAANDVWREALASLNVVPASEYRLFEQPARRRLPADPDDWPYAALALRMDCAIWTKNLAHFAESGIPIWGMGTIDLLLDE